MSLKVYVKHCSEVPERGGKIIRVTFRGVSQITRVVDDVGEHVFDEVLEWPLGRALESAEELRIDLEAFSRYFSNRLLASYTCLLQRLVVDGAVGVTDHMTDSSGRVIKTMVSFEIRYSPPLTTSWDTGLRGEGNALEELSNQHQLGTNSVHMEKLPTPPVKLKEETAELGQMDPRWGDSPVGGRPKMEEGLAQEKKTKRGKGSDSEKEISDEEGARRKSGHKYRLTKKSPSQASDGENKRSLFGRRKNSKGSSGSRTKDFVNNSRDSDDSACERRGSTDDERKMLLDVEKNIANIERNLSLQEKVASVISRNRSKTSSPEAAKKSRRFAGMKAVRSLVRMGRQRSRSSDDEERQPLRGQEPPQSLVQAIEVPRPPSSCSTNSEAESLGTSKIKKPFSDDVNSSPPELKAQDFQVCVTVIEARQLAGLNMDPVVCVQIGDTKKYTSVKESTNCPYYNEYFVFDFHMAPSMLFDKIITLTVLQSRNILRSNKALGSFKLDVATVWAQSEHQFYHKWALLTDPDDATGGPKGYLKCDICVVGKGEAIKLPIRTDRDEDDIEGNLLLPDGVPSERQRAKFIIRIYRADGLPKINSSIIANVKKALTGDTKDLVDPYVLVSFAGLTGRTCVKRGSAAPVWNEQVVFTEMFPPLCQRVKIQLRDNDAVTDTVIGTHFLDLTTLSNDGDKGFLPTFGPAYVYFYGSTRDGSVMDEHTSLNSGLGEGIAYRGRLLLSVRCQITESFDVAPSEVEVENTLPIPESSHSEVEEFLLFASVHEVTMIEKKHADKPVLIELSIGNAGNCLDGSVSNSGEDSDDESGPESVHTETSLWQSSTPPMKPLTNDKMYYFLPFWDDKPCLYIKSFWQDHRRRLYNSNALASIATKLEEGLNDLQTKLEEEDEGVEGMLKEVLEELISNSSLYLSIAKASSTVHCHSGLRTRLDKERAKLCQREVEGIRSSARHTKAIVTKHSLKERLKASLALLHKLKQLTDDPQHSLPDIFIWLICGNRRIAYQRIPARNLIYSPVDLERGKLCGTRRNIFLKLPGRKSCGPGGWAIQAKLDVCLWLGLNRHKKFMMAGVPRGYEVTYEVKNLDRESALPPITLHYIERQSFQLRAHMYQARSLIGSDSSGLSDPFARVIFGEHCRVTQVIDETLSPTWDELLVVDDVTIQGTKEEIKNDPPLVVLEIFDQDKMGKSEFIGRTLAKPRVRMRDEQYHVPKLEWYSLFRGSDHAGELLAAFELIQFNISEKLEELSIPLPKEAKDVGQDIGAVFPVPKGIRPALAKYRLEILFWGLRELKRIHLLTVDRPRVDAEIAGHIVQSAVISSAKKNPNFSSCVKFIDLELPENDIYCPPITVRVVDCRSFGRFTLVGTHIIANLHRYTWTPITARDRQAALASPLAVQQLLEDGVKNCVSPNDIEVGSKGGGGGGGSARVRGRSTPKSDSEALPLLMKETIITIDYGTETAKKMSGITKKQKTELNKRRKQSMDEEEDSEEHKDWWTKYFASLDALAKKDKDVQEWDEKAIGCPSQQTQPFVDFYEKRRVNQPSRFASKPSPKTQRKKQKENVAVLKVLPGELEAEFNGFREWLHSFDLFRGKKTGDDLDDEGRVVGKFKGAIKLYRMPLPADIDEPTIMGGDPQYGFFQGLPSNDPIHVLVRVYVIRAYDLHPMDINGKADPYIVIQLGSKKVSDKENYISKQLNPIIGKCFEIEATFPQDSMLTASVYDWDLVGSDDMIGETKVDLENRFYSRHRATCGLANRYELSGYNQWRDPMKPTQILARLCKDSKIDGPQYSPGKVRIGNKAFALQHDGELEVGRMKTKGGSAMGISEEQMALAVLHRWQEVPKVGCPLVPEHIETRSLFNPDKPGIEQGKLEMWVDMFAMDMPLPGPPLNITPRKPKSFELRVIIWNTDDVVLEDDAFFTGEKMSDIYVKGWLKGPEDTQCTDIHYRSLTGEGNFNWRFVFPFDYLVAEEKIVISRKESVFSWDETECKIPARLELQVWDADHFSADDFLGAVTLDLNRFPRGAKSSKLCTLQILRTDSSAPMVNIFKQRRVKGWWPFYVKKENDEMELTGKVEAEIHLLTYDEAENNPAGLGRSEPDPLEKPNRPDASFMWFVNPIKSVRYIVWHNYKWVIIKFLGFAALLVFFILFFYSIPGFTVKKIIGA